MKTSPPYSNDFVNVETDIANWGLQGVELEFQNVRSAWALSKAPMITSIMRNVTDGTTFS